MALFTERVEPRVAAPVSFEARPTDRVSLRTVASFTERVSLRTVALFTERVEPRVAAPVSFEARPTDRVLPRTVALFTERVSPRTVALFTERVFSIVVAPPKFITLKVDVRLISLSCPLISRISLASLMNKDLVLFTVRTICPSEATSNSDKLLP